MALAAFVFVRPPRATGECLRPDGRCVFPVDRGLQIAVLVALVVTAFIVASAWAGARRRLYSTMAAI